MTAILSRVIVPGLLAVMAMSALGCSRGSQKLTIDGTVSYKGERLRSGILRAVGADGSFATASIRPDGTFTLTDVTPGEIKVGVMEAPQSGGSSDGKSSHAARPPVALPPKAQDPEKSGLSYTITRGTHELAIEIK
jgi:hypothetical protein